MLLPNIYFRNKDTASLSHPTPTVTILPAYMLGEEYDLYYNLQIINVQRGCTLCKVVCFHFGTEPQDSLLNWGVDMDNNQEGEEYILLVFR